MIKDNCQSCGRDLAGKDVFFNRKKYFEIHGNFCKKCRCNPKLNIHGFRPSEEMKLSNELYEHLKEAVEEEMKTGYPK